MAKRVPQDKLARLHKSLIEKSGGDDNVLGDRLAALNSRLVMKGYDPIDRPDTRGVLGLLGAGITQGAAGLYADAAQYAGRKLNSPMLTEFGAATERRLPRPSDSWAYKGGELIGNVGATLPAALTAVATGGTGAIIPLLSMAAGAAAGGAASGQQTYEEALANNATEEEANRYGDIVAPIVTASEMLPFGVGDVAVRKFLPKALATRIPKTVGGRTLMTGFGESGEEIIGQLPQEAVAKYGYDPERPYTESLKNIGSAGAQGFAGGLMLGLPIEIASQRGLRNEQARQRLPIEEAILERERVQPLPEELPTIPAAERFGQRLPTETAMTVEPEYQDILGLGREPVLPEPLPIEQAAEQPIEPLAIEEAINEQVSEEPARLPIEQASLPDALPTAVRTNRAKGKGKAGTQAPAVQESAEASSVKQPVNPLGRAIARFYEEEPWVAAPESYDDLRSRIAKIAKEENVNASDLEAETLWQYKPSKEAKYEPSGIYQDFAKQSKPKVKSKTAPVKTNEQIKPIRFEAGKVLSKEERITVLKNIGDSYKDTNAPIVVKGFRKESGDPIEGYEYNRDYMHTSDITGAAMRHYIKLPDGRIAHPSELFPEITDAKINQYISEEKARANREKHFNDARDKVIVKANGELTEDQKWALSNFNIDLNNVATQPAVAARMLFRSSHGNYAEVFDNTDVWKNNDGDVVVVKLSDTESLDYYKSKGFKPFTTKQEPVVKQELTAPTYYHGTDATFDQFDIRQSKKWNKFGIWFTDNKEFASSFGKNLKEAKLELKNPKRITESQWDAIRSEHAKDDVWFANWKNKLIQQGHDGLVIDIPETKLGKSVIPAKQDVAVFTNEQVKQPTTPPVETAPTGKQSLQVPRTYEQVLAGIGKGEPIGDISHLSQDKQTAIRNYAKSKTQTPAPVVAKPATTESRAFVEQKWSEFENWFNNSVYANNSHAKEAMRLLREKINSVDDATAASVADNLKYVFGDESRVSALLGVNPNSPETLKEWHLSFTENAYKALNENLHPELKGSPRPKFTPPVVAKPDTQKQPDAQKKEGEKKPEKANPSKPTIAPVEKLPKPKNTAPFGGNTYYDYSELFDKVENAKSMSEIRSINDKVAMGLRNSNSYLNGRDSRYMNSLREKTQERIKQLAAGDELKIWKEENNVKDDNERVAYIDKLFTGEPDERYTVYNKYGEELGKYYTFDVDPELELIGDATPNNRPIPGGETERGTFAKRWSDERLDAKIGNDEDFQELTSKIMDNYKRTYFEERSRLGWTQEYLEFTPNVTKANSDKTKAIFALQKQLANRYGLQLNRVYDDNTGAVKFQNVVFPEEKPEFAQAKLKPGYSQTIGIVPPMFRPKAPPSNFSQEQRTVWRMFNAPKMNWLSRFLAGDTDWKTFKSRLKQEEINRLEGLYRAHEMMKGDRAQFEKIIRKSVMGGGQAMNYLEKGSKPRDYEGNAVDGVKSLGDIEAPFTTEKDYEGFWTYAGSRIVVDTVNALPDYQFHPIKGDSDVIVNAARGVVDNNTDARFEKAYDELQKLFDSVLDYMVKSGMITADDKKRIKSKRESYLPLFAELMSQDPQVSAIGSKFANVRSPIRKLSEQGGAAFRMRSDEAVRLVIQRQIQAANNFRVGKELADRHAAMVKADPSIAEQFMTKKGAIPVKIPESQLRTILSNMGMSANDIDVAITTFDLPAVWRKQLTVNAKTGEVQFDGNVYQINDKLLLESLTTLDPAMLPDVLKAMEGTARLFRLTTTGLSIAFNFRNAFRDAFTKIVFSRINYTKGNWEQAIPLAAHFIGLNEKFGVFKGMQNREVYERLRAAGAISGRSEYLYAGESGRGKSADLLSSVKYAKSKYYARHPLQTLEAISAIVEEAPRIAEAKAVYEQAIKDGKTPQEAAELGAEAARKTTLEFERGGKFNKDTGRFWAFFNPSMLGLEQTAQLFKLNNSVSRKNAATYWTRSIMAVTIPTLILEAFNSGEDWYEKRPQWEKDFFWLVRVGGTDKEPFVVKVPKAHAIGLLFSTIPQRIYQHTVRDNKQAFEGLGEAFAQLSPVQKPFVPTAFVPLAEATMNRDVFRQRSIVPQNLEKATPKYQSRETTGETARMIGETFNVSPAKLEHLVKGYTSGMGLDVVRLFDAAMRGYRDKPETKIFKRSMSDFPVVGSIIARQTTMENSNDIEWLYEKHGMLQGNKNARKLEKTDLPLYNILNNAENQVAKIRKLRKDIREKLKTTDNPDERERLFERLGEMDDRAIKIAKQAKARYNERKGTK